MEGLARACIREIRGEGRYGLTAHRVVFIDEGQILEVAPPNDFFTDPQTDRARLFLSKILSH